MLPDPISDHPQISIILPIYQEEHILETIICDLMSTLAARGSAFEVVAVDDGSRDGTAGILRGLKNRYPQLLTVAHHVKNRGNGAALRTGTRLARGEVVVYMDADGQHAAEDIPCLLDLIPPNDLVVGCRTKEYECTWHRRIANRFYNRFASWLTSTNIPDLTSGFRAMRRPVANHFLPLYPDGFSTPTTTTLAFLKAGYNVAFVPVNVRTRAGGKSKINLWKDGRQFIMLILRMVMLYDPQRIFTPVGAGLIGLGLISWAWGLYAASRLVLPNSTIFFFTAAITTWLLGLLASQIASTRIHNYGDETVILDEPEHPGAHD